MCSSRQTDGKQMYKRHSHSQASINCETEETKPRAEETTAEPVVSAPVFCDEEIKSMKPSECPSVLEKNRENALLTNNKPCFLLLGWCSPGKTFRIQVEKSQVPEALTVKCAQVEQMWLTEGSSP